MALLPGVTVSMGGRDWIVPPLTIGQLRRLNPTLRQISEPGVGMDADTIDAIVAVVGAAARRNYPDLDDAALLDLLDLGNAGAVLNAVLTGSGLKATPPGEDQAAGTGALFTASSPPASAIDLATSTS
ncbi:MAG: hypothetical protein IVW56_09615 [Candidatus Binataceae bacterium]|nr:hypothetical protein [Candidatus Binataceae bacterium]